MPDRKNYGADEEPGRQVPKPDQEKPGRDQDESCCRRALPSEPVRDLTSDAPVRDDDLRVHQEHGAAGIDAEFSLVERTERPETGEAEDHKREDEAGVDRCGMDEAGPGEL